MIAFVIEPPVNESSANTATSVIRLGLRRLIWELCSFLVTGIIGCVEGLLGHIGLALRGLVYAGYGGLGLFRSLWSWAGRAGVGLAEAFCDGFPDLPCGGFRREVVPYAA